MTNKVKPFFIRITDDMTPQMVQDAFDKCRELGVDDSELDESLKFNNWYYFGVCGDVGLYYSDFKGNYCNAQEITLDQLDEWLGLEVGQEHVGLEAEWKDTDDLPPAGTKCEVMFTLDTTPRWYQCTISYSCQGVGVLDIEGEKCAFTTASSNGHSVKFRKPETPEQKSERERLEAAGRLVNSSELPNGSSEKISAILTMIEDVYGSGALFAVVDLLEKISDESR